MRTFLSELIYYAIIIANSSFMYSLHFKVTVLALVKSFLIRGVDITEQEPFIYLNFQRKFISTRRSCKNRFTGVRLIQVSREKFNFRHMLPGAAFFRNAAPYFLLS